MKKKRRSKKARIFTTLAHIKEQAKRDTQVIFADYAYLRKLYGE